MNTIDPRDYEHPTAPQPTKALHAAAILAVREARTAKALGDARRERAWLKFAEAATEMYLVERRLP